ncbi:yvgN, partial [Symbiodinium natans]
MLAHQPAFRGPSRQLPPKRTWMLTVGRCRGSLCHDVDTKTLLTQVGPWNQSQDGECTDWLLRAGSPKDSDWKQCIGGSMWPHVCCGTCQRVLHAHEERVGEMISQRDALAAALAQGPRWVSSPLLGSGRRMPLLALGTGGMGGKSAREIIAFALRAGYRHLDSAMTYPSYPDELQMGLTDSGVAREDVFISTKVPPDAMGFEASHAALQRLAAEMPGGYADLCMVHWPNTADQAPASAKDPALWSALERVGTWKALEAAYDAGICKALGVSNYLVQHLQELLGYARIPPAVNQIEYSPTAPLMDVVHFCRSQGIVLEAFAWNRMEVFMQQELIELAQALSPEDSMRRDFLMQVLMRWFIQRGIVPLFRTERQEVVLGALGSLLALPNLTETQLQSLEKPR